MTENQDPPPRKRLRRSSEERVTRSSEREASLRDKHQSKPLMSDEMTTYSAELLLYDRQCHCCLTAGQYDVVVEEPKTNSSNALGKHSTWETVTDSKVQFCYRFIFDSWFPTLFSVYNFFSIDYLIFSALQHICLARYMLLPIRRSVTRVDQSENFGDIWITLISQGNGIPPLGDVKCVGRAKQVIFL